MRTLDPGRLPATLRGLVAARLDALTPGERNVLEDCAVVGSTGSCRVAFGRWSTRGATPSTWRTRWPASGARELVDVENGEFSFASEVVRDVAYGTLAKAERARRHAVLGAWLADQPGGESAGGAE